MPRERCIPLDRLHRLHLYCYQAVLRGARSARHASKGLLQASKPSRPQDLYSIEHAEYKKKFLFGAGCGFSTKVIVSKKNVTYTVCLNEQDTM
jgi:hypothetical protein